MDTPVAPRARTTASSDTAIGKSLSSPPNPLCPYAFPTAAAETPKSASVDASPPANAIPFTVIASDLAFAALASLAALASSDSSSGSIAAEMARSSCPALGAAYPPMYPIVSGKTLSVHGESDVTSPARRTIANVAGVTLPARESLTIESADCAAAKRPMLMSSPTEPSARTSRSGSGTRADDAKAAATASAGENADAAASGSAFER